MADHARLAGALLILFALLTLAAPFLPSHAPAAAETSAEEITAFFRADATLQTLQAWLHAGPAMLFLAAMVLLFPRLRGAGAQGPGLAVTALVAAGGFAFVTFASFVAVLNAIREVGLGADAHVGLFIYTTAWTTMIFSVAFIAPFILVPMGLLARPAGLPHWLRPTSLALGALAALSALATVHPLTGGAAFAGMLVLILWSLLVGIALIVRPLAPATLA